MFFSCMHAVDRALVLALTTACTGRMPLSQRETPSYNHYMQLSRSTALWNSREAGVCLSKGLVNRSVFADKPSIW